jgi:hypothetical protein
MTQPTNHVGLMTYMILASLPYPELETVATAVASFNQAVASKWDLLFRNAIEEWPLVEKEIFKLHAAGIRSLLELFENSIAAVNRAATCAPGPVAGSEKIPVS